MSQPTRADRRRHQRGDQATPPHRDPMTMVYWGVGVAIVVIIAIFGAMRWQQGQQLVAAVATPTPGPSPSGKPIQLADGISAIGVPHFKGLVADAPKGGLGQPVDGIECGSMEYGVLHIHTHVALFANGKQYQIPRLIGGAPNGGTGGCLYWIHTHDASGIIHIEAPQIFPPNGGDHYTLGTLFDIWGQPLGTDGVAGFTGPVTAYVNGAPYTGDLRAIPMLSHQQIVLEVGTPVVPPPNYAFPDGD
jgi:hypothetical protein